jgi:predicted nucleic acid-binding protein
MHQIRIFFDTNVLVYAHDQSSIHHTDSASLLAKVFEGKVQGALAEQNIIELYRILTNTTAMTGKPLTPSQSRSLLDTTYLNGTFEIHYPTLTTIQETLGLAVKNTITSAKIFDARIAILAIDAAVDYLATYNIKDFTNIDKIVPITPTQLLPLIQTS